MPLRPSVDREFDELTSTSAISATWFACAVAALPALFRRESAAYYLSMSGGLFVAASLLTALRPRLPPLAVSRVVLAVGALLIGFASIVTGGALSPAFHSYAIVVVGAVWLVLSPAAAGASVAAVILASAGMTWAGTLGWLPNPWVAHTPWSAWATTVAAGLLLALVQWLEWGRLGVALAAAREEAGRSAQAQREAAQSKQRYKDLISTVPGVVFEFEARPDSSRTFTFMSDGAWGLFGVSPEDALGDPYAIFGLLLPESQLTVLEASIARSHATLEPWELVGNIVTPAGEHKWIRGHAMPSRLPDGTVRWNGFLTDFSARVEVDRALRESRAALKQSVSLQHAALESTADGLLIVNTLGRVTGYNQKLLSLWRAPQALLDLRNKDQLVAFSQAQLVDPASFLKKVNDLYDSPDAVDFDTLHFKDGRCFERYSQPQVVDGVTVGRVWSFRDVTARVEADRRRAELEQQLQHAQKMEALGTLAGGIAHDFNNLLMIILSQAEFLRDEEDPSIRRESVDEIIEASVRASHLIRQIREFSQPQPAERAVVAVAQSIASAVQLLRSTMPKSIDIAASLAPDVTMFADPTQLQQVVTNLVLNAGHAIGEAPGRIDIVLEGVPSSEVPPGVPVPLAERYARLTVRDTGHGIPPEILPRIFDPFFTTKTNSRGSGLGLAVVHAIVSRHRGAVIVHSPAPGGTEFRVYWPALAPAAMPAEPARRQSGVAVSGVGQHILLVDDEAAIVKVLATSLEHIGYKVTPCTDPREALALFTAAPDAVDAVLTDLSMPHMSGLELGRSLLSLRPDVPIVLFTGNSADLSTEDVRAIGFRALVNKPVTPAAIAEVLHRALDGAPGNRRASASHGGSVSHDASQQGR